MYSARDYARSIIRYRNANGNEAAIDKYEKDVLFANNAELSYLFVESIEGANVRLHGKVIIKSKKPFYNYIYPLNIKGTDVYAHQQVIIDSGNLNFMRAFSDRIEGANKGVLAECIKLVEEENSSDDQMKRVLEK